MTMSSEGSATRTRGRPTLAIAACLASVLTLPLVSAGAHAAPAAEPSSTSKRVADTVIVNGKVLQFTKNDKKFARAVAVRDGVITYVGRTKQARKWIGPKTKVVNLKGKLLMPSLGDGHLHGAEYVECHLGYEGGTVETVLGKLKKCLTSEGQEQYLDSNYVLRASYLMGEGMLPQGTRLDRHVLDRLSADPSEDEFGTGTTRPIVVGHMDHHKSYTNTKAIENAGITKDTPDPTDGFIGRDPDGTPNGQFADYYADFGPSTPRPDDIAYRMFKQNLRLANSYGITQVLRPGGGEADLRRARRLAKEGGLNVYLNQALSATSVRGADESAVDETIDGLNSVRDKYDGYSNRKSPGELAVDTVKIYCDGVPEYPGQTAAMEQPYRINVGTPENPEWVFGDKRGEDPSCEDGRLGFTKLDRAKWNIHVHSLGNRSTRVTLDNFAAAKRENRKWDRRHTITHLEFVNPEDVKRFGKLGVVASMSLQWAQRDAWSTHGIEGYLTPKVLKKLYPARDLLDGGAVVAAGSDWPVTDLMPWTLIETAVDREGEVDEAKAIYPGALTPSQKIRRIEAVRASTLGVAYQMHNDDATGSIRKGKNADLIIVDQNIFQVPTEKISETKVLMTMLKGEVIYADRKSR